MLAFSIVILFPLLILGVKKYLSFKICTPKSLISILLWLSLALSLIFITGMVLSHFNLYWRGYRSHTLILIAAGISWIFFYLLRRSDRSSEVVTVFSNTAIFFLAGITLVLGIEVVDDYQKQLFYDSSKYRVEQTNRGLMSPASLPNLFVKKGLFEKRYSLHSEYDTLSGVINRAFTFKDDIIRLEVIKLSSDSVMIKLFHVVDSNFIRYNPLVFKEKID